ncbi:MAG TPA: hypothetical protein VMR21_01070 [Vicinamibacteria bacterium]|nr:hypothetical protein [Vicinamibacteria bacterium]
MRLLWLAALPCLYWGQGVDTAPRLRAAGIERVCVPPDAVPAWTGAGFSASAVSEADRAQRERLPAPGTRPRANRASATRSPWIDASGWRFRRRPEGRYVYPAPAGKVALAAAEAWAYGADAAVEADPGDLEPLGTMQAFLATLPDSALPDVADIGIVDDGSAMMGELMNLMTRRNLLYRIVKERSPELRVNVELGTADYPALAAVDPSAMALKIRRQLSDDERSLRLFGSEAVIGRLTGDGRRVRLHLLNYGGREIEGLRVRLRGSYPAGRVLVAGVGPLEVEEHVVGEGFTELTVPRLGPYGVLDLTRE